MESVGTALLKNKLSAYLKRVRKGARFIVTDRGEPVAKIVPLDSKEATSTEEILVGLVAEGTLTLPRLKDQPFKKFKKIDIGPGNILSEMVKEDREDRQNRLLSGYQRSD